jgi:hypothetical protein
MFLKRELNSVKFAFVEVLAKDSIEVKEFMNRL